jgi:hypothetical protein
MVRFVTCSMLSLGFKEVWIPDEGAVARCPVYCSNGWDQAARLLVILTNQVGGCAQKGLTGRPPCRKDPTPPENQCYYRPPTEWSRPK